MDDLLEAIVEYYHQHGRYPKVKVSGSFWEKHWPDIMNTKVLTDGLLEVSEDVSDWQLIDPDNE